MPTVTCMPYRVCLHSPNSVMKETRSLPGFALRVGQHVVYYRVLEQAVRVERILHVKMDPSRHFQDRQ